MFSTVVYNMGKQMNATRKSLIKDNPKRQAVGQLDRQAETLISYQTDRLTNSRKVMTFIKWNFAVTHYVITRSS